ncbi:MAG: ATP-dependent RecD-like DNA helicase [Desulfobacterota bacterium]|nr:ATP-dependent RecD-like DNA helicase [Thermodesulfobacteriota bacterium]
MTDPEEHIELEGQIETLTYVNEENGYTVAKVRVPGYPEPVTIVGALLSPAPGEVLKMKGLWSTHPRFGRQFKVTSHQAVVPATVTGIRKYLGSGLIKGIGPVMAARIVKTFGERTLEVIDKHIEDLHQVDGIGTKRIEMIDRAWKEQKEIRNVMIFLQGHGVSPAYAAKIFKRYGWDAIRIVSNNPYRLASDIFGIGFRTADKIAASMGFGKDAPARVEAGILYVLHQLSEEGHVYFPYEPLVDRCREILEVDRELIARAIGAISLEKKIVIEDLNQDLGAFQANHKAVYLTNAHIAETGIAEHLLRVAAAPKKMRQIDVGKALKWVQGKIRLEFAAKQIEAIQSAASEKVMVITGGPGTGKTTIINAVLRIYRELGARMLLAAPTGRASKRMSEATGYPARTIHRMLEYNLQKGGFQRGPEHPLEVDVLILDETSMIDTSLMYHLLKAVPSGATLILVGDVNQLPSVGAGNVLKDVIRSGRVPVVELTEIFRQAADSGIIRNAHRINTGLLPELTQEREGLGDFYFIEQEDQEEVLRIIMELVCERIPKRFKLDPLEGIQVLAPMHKGTVGTENLNAKLQEALNPSGTAIARGGRTFRLKDKVMQVRNNYEKDVFNGDIGRITAMDEETREVTVTYDGVPVPYEASDLDEIVHAYAISVHKSQGSEYPAVLLPLLPQHYLLLQRNLIYTAVTRAKKLLLIVGSKKALATAVKNDKIARRYTYLAERLMRA